MYAFDGAVHGENFANPNIRTPWFKEVVRHFIRAEANDFAWPRSGGFGESFAFAGPGMRGADYPPNLLQILYSDLGMIRAAG
jgi:hypothetical protein